MKAATIVTTQINPLCNGPFHSVKFVEIFTKCINSTLDGCIRSRLSILKQSWCSLLFKMVWFDLRLEECTNSMTWIPCLLRLMYFRSYRFFMKRNISILNSSDESRHFLVQSVITFTHKICSHYLQMLLVLKIHK